ncbi:MAG TPA: hypothetical protein VLI07_18785 [Candidatus Binatus sp.]|nr:hypothetical protein [Candidatus Binatus sp.]
MTPNEHILVSTIHKREAHAVKAAQAQVETLAEMIKHVTASDLNKAAQKALWDAAQALHELRFALEEKAEADFKLGNPAAFPVEPAGPQVVILNHSISREHIAHIHRDGCRDIERDAREHGSQIYGPFESVEAALADYVDGEMAEMGYGPEDVRVFPCCK